MKNRRLALSRTLGRIHLDILDKNLGKTFGKDLGKGLGKTHLAVFGKILGKIHVRYLRHTFSKYIMYVCLVVYSVNSRHNFCQNYLRVFGRILDKCLLQIISQKSRQKLCKCFRQNLSPKVVYISLATHLANPYTFGKMFGKTCVRTISVFSK